MIAEIGFSDTSIKRLQTRNISSEDISNFSELLKRAENRQGSAKEFLQSLSKDELALVQQANSLADNINIGGLSAEGAQNLLSQPDGSDLVDLNNDGIVEVGAARTIHFPPVNAPQYVKDAWAAATEGMSPMEKGAMELTLHHTIYGTGIGQDQGQQKIPPSVEQQWSPEGVSQFFKRLYSNLEFRVNLEGWTDHNKMLSQVYGAFESGLQGHDGDNTSLLTDQYSAKVRIKSGENTTQPAPHSQQPIHRQQRINALLSESQHNQSRQGLGKKNLEIEILQQDPSLTTKEKQQRLTPLMLEKESIITQAFNRETRMHNLSMAYRQQS